MPALISDTLAPTRTHPAPGRRAYHYLPAAPGQPHRGTLTITQGRRDADSYRVVELRAVPAGTRRFVLEKLDGSGDVYAVAVGPVGPAGCSGEWCGRCASCKHRDAVLDLLAAGELAPVCPTCAGFGFVPTADLDANSCPTCSITTNPAVAGEGRAA